MIFDITQFEIEAYNAVFSLWKQCDGIGLSAADSRESIQGYLKRNPGMSFLAGFEDKVVGAVLAGHDGRRGYIHHLAVHPNYRRHGLARKLVERCLTELAGAGIQKCHLFIFNDNIHGIEFWKRIGWDYRSDISVVSKIIGPNSASG